MDTGRGGRNPFVYGFLTARHVPHEVADTVAREAAGALSDAPGWHASSTGRLELHIRLFRAMADAGQASDVAILTGALLKEMRHPSVIATNRALLLPLRDWEIAPL